MGREGHPERHHAVSVKPDESPTAGSAAMPRRYPRCCICNEYKARRRLRDREGIQHLVCYGCVPAFLKNLRGIKGEQRT